MSLVSKVAFLLFHPSTNICLPMFYLNFQYFLKGPAAASIQDPHSRGFSGWSGDAMVLGKLPVPGRPGQGRVAQSVGHLTRKSGVLGSIPGLATYFRFSFRVVCYWRKYVHEVLVNRLGGLSLPRKSVVRLTYRPDMTLDVYPMVLGKLPVPGRPTI